MPRETIARFPKGIRSSPGHEDGSWDGAQDMKNLDVGRLGRPELRSGYVEDDSTVFGSGEQLAKVHFIGNSERPPFSKLFRFHKNESWVSDNGRIIIAGANVDNRWIDVEDNTVYDWKNEGVRIAPIRIYDPTDLQLKPSFRKLRERWIGNDTSVALAYEDVSMINRLSDEAYLNTAAWDKYAICITYYSIKFGIETPPIYARTFDVEFTAISPNNRRGIGFNVQIDTSEAPPWADTLRFYITNTPIATRGYLYDVNNVIEVAARHVTRDIIPVKEITEELGLEFGLVRQDPRQANGNFLTNFGIVMLFDWKSIGTHQFEGTILDSIATFGVVSGVSNDLYQGYLTDTLGVLGNYLSGTPPNNLNNLLLYAGRLWGYDRDTNSVRFSLIDGNGISQYDVFPYEDTHLPHAITFVGGWQSTVTHMSVIPGDGGIYVFFRDAIRTIVGKSLLSGLYSPEVSPQTDLDASGGIEGFGTLSPRSVVEFRNVTIFLGSDRTLYQLVGASLPQDFGLAIQPFLDEIHDNDLERVTAFGYNDKYHLILRTGIFVLDIKRKYWTRYDYPIVDAFWSSGGLANESILYGLLRK